MAWPARQTSGIGHGQVTTGGGRPAGSRPAVVLLHGDYWDSVDRLTRMDGLARDVTARGWVAWNLEYRPTQGGGGWPHTFDDVAAGVDRLARSAAAAHVDLARVA